MSNPNFFFQAVEPFLRRRFWADAPAVAAAVQRSVEEVVMGEDYGRSWGCYGRSSGTTTPMLHSKLLHDIT